MSKNSSINLMTLFSNYPKRLSQLLELSSRVIAPVARRLLSQTKASNIVIFVRYISVHLVEIKNENSQWMTKTTVTSAKFARGSSISRTF